jgi:hypothetical protein
MSFSCTDEFFSGLLGPVRVLAEDWTRSPHMERFT